MKTIDIAIKDLTRSFRSMFALVFMFAIPLLVTGMFYLMFGNTSANQGFNLPRTKVVIANLDAGSSQFQANTTGEPLGEMVVQTLQSEDFTSLMQVSIAPDAAAAHQAVDSQQAGVAIIIPANFSASFADTSATATVEIYKDPTLTLGPGVVQSVLRQFMDGFSGVKIAVNTALKQAEAGKLEYARSYSNGRINQIVKDYMAAALNNNDDPVQTLLDVRSPSASAQQPDNLVLRIIGPFMGGMMIFFAFFTGTNTAQSILKEEEEGTLPRLFTTPTTQATILGGKFLAVGLTVVVQIIVLLVVAHLIFGIEWGALPAVMIFSAGTVIAAATFGIFVNSLLKNTRQGGIIFGGLLTFTGMIGMLPIFLGSAPNTSPLLGTISLFVPQGWAGRGMSQAMNGAPLTDVILTSLVLLAWSLVFFVVGVWQFQRRYA